MITIRVCAEDNSRPIRNVRVAVAASNASHGVTGDEWTDGCGEVRFDCATGEGQVLVRGQAVYHGPLAGRVVVYV